MASSPLAPARDFLEAVEDLGVCPLPGGIDLLLELLEEVEDSPGAAVFSPGLLGGIRVDLLAVQKEPESEHRSYLKALGKMLQSH
jgi:hypothetical protein